MFPKKKPEGSSAPKPPPPKPKAIEEEEGNKPEVEPEPELDPTPAPAPDPDIFHWKGRDYNLKEFTEFRYYQNYDRGGVIEAKLFRVEGGEEGIDCATLAEAREFEASVNPFWGRS